jgi:hypothetical protein
MENLILGKGNANSLPPFACQDFMYMEFAEIIAGVHLLQTESLRGL